MRELSFRPHHFLCTLGFQGKGYSPAFVDNFQRIVDQLQKDETTLIRVVGKSDTICEACPHEQDSFCITEVKIRQLDQAHQQVLQLPAVVTWAAAKKRLREEMSLEKFHQVCGSCEWKVLGICEQALQQLHTS
jgi:uncharacterized protein